MKGRRIGLTLKDEQFKKIIYIKEKYRFRSICEVISSMINIYIALSEEGIQPRDVDDEEFIREMFDGLSNIEKKHGKR